MSRYLLLVILNMPFVTMGIVSSTTQYKIGRLSKNNYLFQLLFWIFITLSLILAEPIYNSLYSSGLTSTESLSLFDVIQITAIIILLYGVNRARIKIESMERRFREMHQEISIRLSRKNR